MEASAVASPAAADRPIVVTNARFGERFVFTHVDGERCRFEFTVAPKKGMPMLHAHARQSEVFRVVRGELTVLLAEGERQLRAGEELVIEPGTFHAFENRADVEVVCDVEYRPAGRNREWLMVANAIERARGSEPGLLDLAPFIGDVDIFIKGPPVWLQRAMFAGLKPLAVALGRRDRWLAAASEQYGVPVHW